MCVEETPQRVLRRLQPGLVSVGVVQFDVLKTLPSQSDQESDDVVSVESGSLGLGVDDSPTPRGRSEGISGGRDETTRRGGPSSSGPCLLRSTRVLEVCRGQVTGRIAGTGRFQLAL